MPSAEASLFAILNAGAVSAIVGSRIYPDLLPQNVQYPAVRLQRISTARNEFRTLTGRAEYAAVRMQIDSYAISRSGAITLAQAVYDILEGYTATVGGLRIDAISTADEGASAETDVGPNGATIYGQRLDVIVYHAE